MDIEFVNRVNERLQLTELIQQNNTDVQVIFICGSSGIGKTAFIENVLKVFANKHIYKVQTKHSEGYSGGYYYRELARSISNEAGENNSLTSYIKGFRSSVANTNAAIRGMKSFRSSLVKTIPSLTIKALNSAINAVSEIREFNEDTILNAYNVEAYSIIDEYIQYELNQGEDTIIHFENIQDIDKTSFDSLISLIKQAERLSIIFEYTHGFNGNYSLHELIDWIEPTGAKIVTMEIGPLSDNDIVRIIEQIPNAQKSIITDKLIADPHNLRSLIDYLYSVFYRQYQVSGPQKHDFTKDSLNILDSEKKFVLSLILSHIEPVSPIMLDEIDYLFRLDNPYSSIKEVIESLVRDGFVTPNSLRHFVISHDYISTIMLQDETWEKYQIISLRFWLNYYATPHQGISVSKTMCLCKQLYYASCLKHYAKVLHLLDDLYDEIARMIAPDSCLDIIRNLKTTLPKPSQMLERIDLWLITLYCGLSDYKKAYDIICASNYSGQRFTIIKIIVLEEIGAKEEALELCEKELDKAQGDNLGYCIALRSTRIMLNHILGNYKKASAEYYECINNKDYQNHIEYGYILRNAELIYSDISYKNSLPPIWESVRHFKNFGAPQMEAYSRITYGVQAALAGWFTRAEKQFEIARRLLCGEITERHSIYNNIAVVRMFQSNNDDYTKWALQQARLTVKPGFDFTAICVNLLALLDWRGENESALKLIPELIMSVETRKYYDVEIVASAYYNIAKFYEKLGDECLYGRYINEAKKYVSNDDLLWRYRINGTPLPDKHNNWVDASVNRALSFISNWHLDFDLHHMQY